MQKIVLLFAIVLFAGSCQLNGQTQSRLDPTAFEQKIKSGSVQILDVRTSKEYKSGYIDNAMLADWLNEKQFNERTQHLDKSRPVLVYCASGIRSAEAAEVLRTRGYTVFELVGGMNKWKREGKPVKGDKPVSQMGTEDFNKLVQQSNLVLVDFGATWCPPCRKMEPVLQQLEKDLSGQFALTKIDAGVHTALMKQMNVEALPHFFVYKNGQKVWDKQGIVSLEELKKALQL
ncbi:thioredoxin domain-containing protein [Flavihumibacter stibioxidans]|uniref:thioredoxin domain-containing protein n=1 Tax=Flavihumibacter stibioxidans TaxID=1834163 RepID=UPI00165080B0|nr:thioredoxin domain-containing protein [Flavihumibacter stibioxidans]